MAKEKITNQPSSPKENSQPNAITASLEYTPERLFTYGTIVVGVVAVYAAVIYLGVQQLKNEKSSN